MDLIRQKDLQCSLIPVTITAGEHSHYDRGYRSVPKRDLIAVLELMLERRELRIAAQLPNRARLVDGLMNMRATPTRDGRHAFGAAARAHDDLMMALSLACWAARRNR